MTNRWKEPRLLCSHRRLNAYSIDIDHTQTQLSIIAMIESTTRNIPAILIAGLLVIALSLIFVCQDGKNGSAGFVRMFFQPKNTISMRITEEFSEAEIQAMREQLIPKKLVIRKNDSPGTLGETKTELTLSANQFLHHHHMKTGGE